MVEKKPKNIARLTNSNFWVLPFVAAILVLVVVLTNRQDNKQQPLDSNNSPTPTTSSQKDKEDEIFGYDEETRTITSPIIERHDGTKFKYTLMVPEQWSVQKSSYQGLIYNLIVAKNNHLLDINSIFFGTSICAYPGDKPVDGGYELFDQYHNLNTYFGEIRIGRNKPGMGVVFRSCLEDSSRGGWETGSRIGFILYRVPLNYDTSIISEMDNILKNIRVIEL